MENKGVNTYDLYHDIQARCGGEIYIGILGPVRTGKSTFIKHFMEEMVLPFMTDENAKVRAMDELPQSADGKTITTTEPKFVPKEAAKIVLNEDLDVKVRLIDCVGYMVEGAVGHLEAGNERMVKTPWFENAIPFTQAAEIGTDKVMTEHSTIGLVITTDGSIGELSRNQYLEAEEKTILELKRLHKPFMVLVNTQKPFSEEAKSIAEEITNKYNVVAMPINCEQLKKDDIHKILERVLYEFPISSIEFFMPKWVEMLSNENPLKMDIIRHVKDLIKEYDSIRDVLEKTINIESEYVKRCQMERIGMSDGVIRIRMDVDDMYYYQMLSDMVGEEIKDEYQLISKLKDFASKKKEYAKVLDALSMVRGKGYGVVTPETEEIVLDKPELIKHGNKYGVKIKAISPSIHMIRANIETEIAPIVGTKEQADDLIQYINQADAADGIWDTNIFGKTIEQLVADGITSKVVSIGDDSQMKLQDTMQKIVNDSNGGMVCIII